MSDYDRRDSIGSSQIAAVCGVHPYMSAFDVWAQIHEGVETPENEPMYWGTALEPVVLARFARDRNATLTYRPSKKSGIARATPDAVWASEGVVEAKTGRSGRRWGDPGTSAIPEEYICQVQWQMGMFDLPKAFVPVLLAGQDFRIYEVDYDFDFYRLLLEKAAAFWRDHILTGAAPTITATDTAKQWLKRFRPEPGEIAELPPGLVQKLAYCTGHARDSAEQLEVAKNEVKALMGNATLAEGSDWKITWNSIAGRTTTDWREAYYDLAASATLAKVGSDLPGIIAKRWTKTAEPTRRFVARFDEE